MFFYFNRDFYRDLDDMGIPFLNIGRPRFDFGGSGYIPTVKSSMELEISSGVFVWAHPYRHEEYDRNKFRKIQCDGLTILVGRLEEELQMCIS